MSSLICTVDVVLLTLVQGRLHVALFRREREPFLGAPALLGGYVHPEEDQDTLSAALRVLRDKAGLEGLYLEQLHTFSGPVRDARGWSLSVAYLALVSADVLSEQTRGNVSLADVSAVPRLPFDHNDIVQAAVARVRGKSLYSSLPAHLCPAVFTLPQLQQVYEQVLGESVPKVSFRRKVGELDMLEEVPEGEGPRAAHRPAQEYRLKPAFRQALALSPRPL